MPCTRPRILKHGRLLNVGPIRPGEELQIKCAPEYEISSDRRVACISGDLYTTGNMYSEKTLPSCNRELLNFTGSCLEFFSWGVWRVETGACFEIVRLLKQRDLRKWTRQGNCFTS